MSFDSFHDFRFFFRLAVAKMNQHRNGCSILKRKQSAIVRFQKTFFGHSHKYEEREENGYSLAWMHHKGRNRHHYEYWTDLNLETKRYAPVPMPRVYFTEMVMDRIAACKVYHGKSYRDGDALDYFEHALEARESAMMHPQTRRELTYILTMLRDRGEKETFRFLREVVLRGKPFAEE